MNEKVVECPWCKKSGFKEPSVLGTHMLQCPKMPQINRIGPWVELKKEEEKVDEDS